MGSDSVYIISPMLFDCHLDNLSNIVMLDMVDMLKSWHGLPLHFDVATSMGFHAMVYAGNQGYNYYDRSPLAFAGVVMSLGTMEVFMDSMSIDRIAIDDPMNMAKQIGKGITKANPIPTAERGSLFLVRARTISKTIPRAAPMTVAQIAVAGSSLRPLVRISATAFHTVAAG